MYEKYAHLRDSKGLRDADVSRETGVSSTTLSEWKAAKSQPKIEKLKLLADFFGVTIDYFVS